MFKRFDIKEHMEKLVKRLTVLIYPYKYQKKLMAFHSFSGPIL